MEKKVDTMDKRTQILVALAGGMVSSSIGIGVALSSSLIPQVIEEGLATDFRTGSWIATSYLYAAIPASLVGAFFNDIVGRRLMTLICCLPLLLGTIITAMAKDISWLLLGRILTSMSGWICYPSATVLITECVHPSVRGYLAVFPSIFLAFGMFQSYLLGYMVHWRTMCWILCYQPFLMFILISCIKDSPYWLIQKGRKEQATASLQWYRGRNYDISEELNEILTKKEEDQKSGTLKEKLEGVFSLTFLKCLSCSGILLLWENFTGISSLVVFMTNVLEASGLTFNPKLAPIIIGGIRVVTACFSSAALRTANRLYMYCGCALVIAISCFLLASFSYWREQFLSASSALGLLPLILTVIMFIAHAFGINSVIHVLAAEIFPTKIRSIGSSTTMGLGVIGNALNSTVYPVMQGSAGFSGCFWFYSCCSFVMACYGYFVIPDNRGLSLVKIERKQENCTGKEELELHK